MGTLLHALFARVEFLDECDPERLLAEYLQEISPRTDQREREELSVLFRRAVSTPDARLLNRPETPRAEVWREKNFSVRRNGELLSCTFDRVVIACDEQGTPLRVQLVDYKSDRQEDPDYYRTLYSGQIERYAAVLESLFHLPVERVIFLIRSGKKLILQECF